MLLKVNNIHNYYGDSHILHGVSLDIGLKSIVGILGRNGAGKTTTINSIIGLVPPKEGEIIFKDMNIVGQKPFRIAQMGIGLIPQGRHVFPSLTVRENLLIVARATEKNQSWDLERTYSYFPILKSRANSWGYQLSGGEQQMLAIARALMTNPILLLVDEPSEGLSPLVLKMMLEALQMLKEDGLSILLIEQNYRAMIELSDYIYIMSNGRIVYHSRTKELEENQDIKSLYLGL